MAKKNAEMFGFINTAVKQSKNTEENIKDQITILPELQSHIPPLSFDEFEQLESNILKDGCRDALIVWESETPQGKRYILIDGHNRHRICLHHKIDFKVELIKFNDIEEVKDWMINNQLGKRNVTEEVKSYLRGQQYQQQKDANAFKGNQFTEKSEGKSKQKTHERLAELHRVSPKTIQRDEKYTKGLDKLVGNNQELKWKILKRDIVIPKNIVEAITEKDTEEIKMLQKVLIETQTFPQDWGKKEPNPRQEDSSKQEWEKWETELLQAFKKLKKKKDLGDLEKIKSLIAQIEQQITQ